MRLPAVIAFLLVALCAGACRRKGHDVARGFYYWKTSYDISVFEQNTLHRLQVRRMFIRMFDVDWEPVSQRLLPVAPVRLPGHMDTGMAYVPVVFITQAALAHIQGRNADTLAQQLASFTRSLCDAAGIAPAELQIDCDWTAAYRQQYFSLLQAIRRTAYMQGKALSCTIRLHQVKYFAGSGIPPVDRGTLMCYSMGDIKKPGPRNSILDVDEAKRYLSKLGSYGLPLDVALPVFSWCILFRDKEFRGILHSITPEMVAGCRLFEHTQDNLYTCLHDTVWLGRTLLQHDVVRTEEVTAKQLNSISDFVASRLPGNSLNVLLFSCDSITLSKYSVNELEKVYRSYH